MVRAASLLDAWHLKKDRAWTNDHRLATFMLA